LVILFYSLKIYTKTIIRLRLSDYGEYSLRFRLGEYSPVITSPSANNWQLLNAEILKAAQMGKNPRVCEQAAKTKIRLGLNITSYC
jgi:hypothetical protein